MPPEAIPCLSDYPALPAVSPRPLLSVITTVRNGEKTLGRTMDSIRAQRFPGLEYIVVDACSTDGTHDIIRANADLVTHWISERDRGISDGFNKGIALSRGAYVALLNADDWLSPGQLAQGIRTLEESGADFVFGDLLYHDEAGRPLYRIRGEADYARRIGHVMPGLNHPTVIVRRCAYEKAGLFDLGLKLAMDYDFLLRLHRQGGRGVYDPIILGHMALEGVSDTSGNRALDEVRDIAIRHGALPPLAWARYGFRLIKTTVRRALERRLPASVAHSLRSSVNRNYTQIPR